MVVLWFEKVSSTLLGVIPEELAVQKLFLHQAEIDSIEVSDQEVLQQVESRISWLTVINTDHI